MSQDDATPATDHFPGRGTFYFAEEEVIGEHAATEMQAGFGGVRTTTTSTVIEEAELDQTSPKARPFEGRYNW